MDTYFWPITLVSILAEMNVNVDRAALKSYNFRFGLTYYI